MCGIFGAFSAGRTAPDPRMVERSLETLRHRGPDDEGYVFVDTRSGDAVAFGGDDTPTGLALPRIGEAAPPPGADLVLAARRLAIQDLSPSGHQPMASADGSLWIVYNGEVYNFHELRRELEALGHRFRTGTDTEVVLQAYERWGTACLDRFNGMWAFAMWDGRRRSLFLARDRFGVKPLYYRWDGTSLSFASEAKALLAHAPARANDRVVSSYLAYGHVDESDETFFAGIEHLPPASQLALRPGGAISVRRWYDLPAPRAGERDADPGHFRDLLENAVHLRLISDVPVGTCLSGGLDSSAIVCLVDRLLQQGDHAGSAERQMTFSARYDDQRHDEGQWIDAVREATSIEPHSVRPDPETLQDDLERLVWHQDEPFGSTSIYAQWSVFRLAREHGAVVTLDGQGGDEVAGGYTHYFGPNLARLLLAGRMRALAHETASHRRNHDGSLASLAARFGAALLPWAARRRLAARARRPSWLRGPSSAPPAADVFAAMPREPLQAQIYRDIVLGLRQLLRVCDRNSMAHSVESRLPFLDYRLVELGYRTPADAKIRDGTTKMILREGLQDVLPAAIARRQSKIGFSTPEDVWFRAELRPLVESVIGSPSFRARPYFDPLAVEQTYAEHLGGRVDRSREIWRWLNFELWARRFLD